MTDHDHPAFTHRCPFCGADPGTPCVTRTCGKELDRPHSRRIAHTKPPVPARPPRQALCCVCGQLRTFSSNYWFSFKDENRGGGFGEDPRGWLWTGTLKCAECGCRTRHALIRDPAHTDYTEAYQRYVLGGPWLGKYAPDQEQMRKLYFAQFPRNPNLNHWYSTAEAATARASGQSRMRAKCGDMMEVPPEHSEGKGRESEPGLIKPKKMRDQEYEDAETGLWWVDMDCVNCLSVVNAGRTQRAREDLVTLIRWYFVRSHLLNAAELDEVRTFLRDNADRTWQRWQEERQSPTN